MPHCNSAASVAAKWRRLLQRDTKTATSAALTAEASRRDVDSDASCDDCCKMASIMRLTVARLGAWVMGGRVPWHGMAQAMNKV